MKNQNREVTILGAGLAGLSLAYQLKKQGIEALILEARDRIGGRIQTIENACTTLELGATWFADKHQHLNGLLEELGLGKVEQYYGQYALYQHPDGQVQMYELPLQTEASYRISGGTFKLIEALAEQLNQQVVLLNRPVRSLHFQDEHVVIKTEEDIFQTDLVINTLPPRLFTKMISCVPELPEHIRSLFENTHTWMGESIKVGFFAKNAFWKEMEIGTLYSQRGPITELYDHSNEAGFALKGFMAESFNQLSPKEREQAAREQLKDFFDASWINELIYVEESWKDQSFTSTPYKSSIFPHQNNGHHLLREPLYSGKLLLGGSETAQYFPGYLDGAVEASVRVASFIAEQNRK